MFGKTPRPEQYKESMEKKGDSLSQTLANTHEIKTFLPRSNKQEVFKLQKLWISVWSLCIQEFRDCTNILLIITHPNNYSLTPLNFDTWQRITYRYVLVLNEPQCAATTTRKNTTHVRLLKWKSLSEMKYIFGHTSLGLGLFYVS